jgi:hypothetical protein
VDPGKTPSDPGTRRPGTLGNHRNTSIEGPRYWTTDLGLSRLINFADRQSVELRVEVFNLLPK